MQAFDLLGAHHDLLVCYLAGLLAERRLERAMKDTPGPLLTSYAMTHVASNPTSAMGYMMYTLASSTEFQQTAHAQEFARRITQRDYSELFLATFDDYAYRYGERGFKEIDVASERLMDQLELFYAQLSHINIEDNQLLQLKARKDDAVRAMRKIATQRSRRKRRRVDRALRTIELTYGHIETPKYLVAVLSGCLHKLALEVGDQLVAQGRLTHRTQIFDLHLEQISRAQKHPALELSALIKTNLRPLDAIKEIERFPHLIDSRGKILRKRVDAKDGELAGMPISRGIYRGRANVLRTPYEKPLKPGEILVTVATEPSWTPVFANASAVVLEVGGSLQHGAIIAREYGLPCVSGLHGVTQIIKDGDLIEVDGTHGIVRIIQTARDESASA